jgi:ABC-type nitrate/sulfonate/bicarbonate transport system substrate-binding protein
MSVPARCLTTAISIAAAMSGWVGRHRSFAALLREPGQSHVGAALRRDRGGIGSERTALRLASLLSALLSVSAAAANQAAAAEGATIRVNTFPNAKALPVHVGLAKGLFAKYGLAVELTSTESSQSQRDGLAAGRFQVAHAALDNAVAMIEVAKRDAVIVSGGDSGMNEFFVQPEISSFADLRGKTIVVDAPDTAYALQAKKLMLQHGLREAADYTVKPVGAVAFRYKAMIEDKSNAGGILNLPFTVEAAERGLKSLGGLVDLLGPYQAAGAFVMRAWARDNADALTRYLAAYVQALRWIRDRRNRTEAVDLLVKNLKLDRKIAERTYDLLVVPASGFTPDARFDVDGFRNMLALRAEIARTPETEAAPPERYVDLHYYEEAMKLIGQ